MSKSRKRTGRTARVKARTTGAKARRTARPSGKNRLLRDPCGPVTALRVVGLGTEVPLDPRRSEFVVGRAGSPEVDVQLPFPSISGRHALMRRQPANEFGENIEVIDADSKNGSFPVPAEPRQKQFEIRAGNWFALGVVELLALDERAQRLVQPVTDYAGSWEVDEALNAIMQERPLLLCGRRTSDALTLARTIHANSRRARNPFIELDTLPMTPMAIRQFLAHARYATILIDLTQSQKLPHNLAKSLLSYSGDYWSIMVTPSLTAARESLRALSYPELDISMAGRLGFPRPVRAMAGEEVQFARRS